MKASGGGKNVSYNSSNQIQDVYKQKLNTKKIFGSFDY